MNDLSPLEALAADYVLGQLDAAERQAVAARIEREPELRAAVTALQRRLAPLDDLTPAVTPPEGVLEAIEARIAAGAPGAARSGNVVDLTRRLGRWRAAAGLSGALAACLAIALLVREADRPSTGNLVAVLQKDAASPAFILTVDLASRAFTVRSVSPEPQADKSYELWLVSDKLGAPRSLGVVGGGTFDTGKALAGYDRSVVVDATYAITLEQKGGSPTGKAQGPLVYAGKLVQATP